ncbi:glycosyltransferase [Patescibacteria group bacterium]|nr:MAG: glycosyltransferase [Patescibacteria group bacterium]
MKTAPTVSIVVPTLNEEKYLPDLAASIDAQTAPPLEVIAVDKSTDTTPQLIMSYGYTKVAQGQGVATARDQGFEVAKGDIIVSTDADSVLPPTYIEAVQRVFADPAVAAVFGPVYLSDGPWIARLASRSLFSLFLRFSLLIRRPNLNGMNFACRASAYRKTGGFNRKLITGEDVELGYRLQRQGRIVYDPAVKVYTSARRVKGQGILGFTWYHIKNFLRLASGRPGSTNFKQFR